MKTKKVILYEDFEIVNKETHPLKEVICNLVDRGDILEVINKAKILEIGCGSGVILKALKEREKEIEGIDPSEVAIKICKEKGLKVYLSDIEHFNPLKKYNYIICIDTLYYLSDFNKNFNKIISLLEEKGILITNFYNPFRKTDKFITVSKEQFNKAVKENNLSMEKVYGNFYSMVKLYFLQKPFDNDINEVLNDEESNDDTKF